MHGDESEIVLASLLCTVGDDVLRLRFLTSVRTVLEWSVGHWGSQNLMLVATCRNFAVPSLAFGRAKLWVRHWTASGVGRSSRAISLRICNIAEVSLRFFLFHVAEGLVRHFFGKLFRTRHVRSFLPPKSGWLSVWGLFHDRVVLSRHVVVLISHCREDFVFDVCLTHSFRDSHLMEICWGNGHPSGFTSRSVLSHRHWRRLQHPVVPTPGLNLFVRLLCHGEDVGKRRANPYSTVGCKNVGLAIILELSLCVVQVASANLLSLTILLHKIVVVEGWTTAHTYPPKSSSVAPITCPSDKVSQPFLFPRFVSRCQQERFEYRLVRFSCSSLEYSLGYVSLWLFVCLFVGFCGWVCECGWLDIWVCVCGVVWRSNMLMDVFVCVF